MKYFVFDVESMGLHGDAFSFGYVVIEHEETTGKYYVLEEEHYAVEHRSLSNPLPGLSPMQRDATFEWVNRCVPIPDAKCMLTTPESLRELFWKIWLRWSKQGAVAVADCPWPVEARFLAKCVEDDPDVRNCTGPYPLIDVSSVLHAAKMASKASGYEYEETLDLYDRRENELPEHNPLCDARQSARILVEVLNTWE